MSAARSLETIDHLPRMSEAEYLRFEQTSEVRHEFDHGVITAMAGGTAAHSQIKIDLSRELGNALAPRGCSYFDSDMRVRIDEMRYVYPDAAATCEDPQIHAAEGGESLVNPSVVFEVLSDSSEAYDRGEKFHKYRLLPSMRDYVLILQDRPRVEVISFGEDGETFRVRVSEGLDASAEIPSLGISLRLAELYRQVRFEPAKPADEASAEGESKELR